MGHPKLCESSPGNGPWRNANLRLNFVLPAWSKVLANHRHDLQCSAIPTILTITFRALYFSVLHSVQESLFGRRVSKTQITKDPIFVIGHWRSGTTLMHELLCLDQRHSFPSTYACMNPAHFLFTEAHANRAASSKITIKRPMDNVRITIRSPQEDEFALCALGAPSPYETLLFPSQLSNAASLFDFVNLDPRVVDRWKEIFVHFIKQLTFCNPKRLILKSPSHTFRIKVLKELFPDARYIHIVRNPLVVLASTLHLWKTMFQNYALLRPDFENLEKYVLETYLLMHRRLDESRPLIARSNFYELHYEELVNNPTAEMRRLYDYFDLGDFDSLRPRIEDYGKATSDYETNRYNLSAATVATFISRCGDIIARFGYEIGSARIQIDG